MENENGETATSIIDKPIDNPVNSISISNEELKDMYMTGRYNAGIVRSVSSKRRGRNIVLEFTLTDSKTVTMNY